MYSYLNILVPVYNEGENIGKTLYEIREKVKTDNRIYVIYDFDEDDTLPAVQGLMQEYGNVSLLKNSYGGGALNAIKTGFDAVHDGVVLVVMADLSDDLAVVDEMFGKVCEGYEIVCGSRYMKGGKQIGGPLLKKLLSRTAGISLNLLVGIPTRDATNSFKMYTKKVLDDIEIESNGGFELGMEIVIKAFIRGHRICEVPSVWRDRSAGVSRFRLWKWMPKYLNWYFLGIRNAYRRRLWKGSDAILNGSGSK